MSHVEPHPVSVMLSAQIHRTTTIGSHTKTVAIFVAVRKSQLGVVYHVNYFETCKFMLVMGLSGLPGLPLLDQRCGFWQGLRLVAVASRILL